jgi:hypothetical protein
MKRVACPFVDEVAEVIDELFESRKLSSSELFVPSPRPPLADCSCGARSHPQGAEEHSNDEEESEARC